MFGIEKDFQQLMEQAYGPLGEKHQMPFNNEIEKTKKEIEVLTKKLSFLEELEKTKSPAEEAYKDAYGKYPVKDVSEDLTPLDNWNVISWDAFQKGYDAAYEEKVAQEPSKDVVSLYERFVNEGAYGMTSFENALKIVRGFLIDEGVIECEDEEYITFTLQKSLLNVPND
ncbi:Hypothetical-Protein / belonging to T4-LIKE GC: 790 [Synechococcus phage S-PM2]|uniref:Hypothetical-Protein belonging to T4-LIKE GC: 790 n=1 Tax=Synechococcus phage S-PM2 TaxID=238854 RepID=Q5GQP3_BPSYP|nr:Hypothetical-Protein / belonging to T4-LIKE GC: 790 [Synechococcus phage S-PM2]CAF34109.1 Hypothetical-Protein / belonging to T4-LIKE GC: 790 [Synechococcus phage S-PM2]